MRSITTYLRYFLLSALVLISVEGWGQMINPVHWSFSSVHLGGDNYAIICNAKIDNGYHLYSQHLESTDGPLATEFTFEKGNDYNLDGAVIEKTPVINHYEKVFSMNVRYFANHAVFMQKIKALKGKPKIKGSIYFMSCNDKNCTPPITEDFNIDLSKAKEETKKETEKISETKESTIPVVPATSEKKGLEVSSIPASHVKWTFEVKKDGDKTYRLEAKGIIDDGWKLLPDSKLDGAVLPFKINIAESDSLEKDGLAATESKTIEISQPDGAKTPVYEKSVLFVQKFTSLKSPKRISGSVEFAETDNKSTIQRGKAEFNQQVPQDQSLAWIFWAGVIAGLGALLTPCVYPMIPLTISFFTKNSEKKAKGVADSLTFGLAIIGIFVGLGLLITVVFGRDALQNLSTNVYTNLLFFAIFIFFAFSFLGAFEITLPTSWVNKSDSRAEKGGIVGIFFVALTLVIVSFSCTSAFISTLLIQASNGSYGSPAMGMLGFSLSWAIPFTSFAMFPKMMQKLPKSGGWLNAVKVSLGFIELALALKFLSTADLTYNWGFLKREYFLALWIIIFGMLGFYLLGKIRLSHDTPVTHISVIRLLFALVTFAFTLYLIPGLWGAPVKLLSGIAPPSTYSEWNHEENLGMKNDPPGQGAAANASAQDQKPHKYHELFKSPHGINAYYDYDEALAAAKKEHKPLMIDFTGHACTNCRLMEENVWSDPTALRMLKNDYVLVSLYADDKTDLPDNEVFVSKYTGKKITKLGPKWVDFETGRFNTFALPYYILLDNNENILDKYPGYDPDVSRFVSFLEKGKSSFKSQSTAMVK